MITQDRLKEVLDYNPETGLFLWKLPSGNRLSGDEAGSFDSRGYVRISIDRVRHRAHRLAILYMDGYMPKDTVDHVDRVHWHNWRSNLRESQQMNCSMLRNNTSTIKGVSWHQGKGKWSAYVVVDKILRHLGDYDTILDAAYARFAAEQCLGFVDWDANSSAKQYIAAH